MLVHRIPVKTLVHRIQVITLIQVCRIPVKMFMIQVNVNQVKMLEDLTSAQDAQCENESVVNDDLNMSQETIAYGNDEPDLLMSDVPDNTSHVCELSTEKPHACQYDDNCLPLKKSKIIISYYDSVKSDVPSQIGDAGLVLSGSPEYDLETPTIDSDNAPDNAPETNADAQSAEKQSQENNTVEGKGDSDKPPGESAKEESDDGAKSDGTKPESKPNHKKRKLKIKLFGVRKRKKKQVTLKCNTCKSPFSSVHELNQHTKQHHPVFKCSICGHTYETKVGLYKRERSHLEKKHKCNQCGKGFQFPSLLRLHEHTHSKEALIPCTNCPQKFTVNSQMLTYDKTHHTKDSFACDKCPHKTNSQYNLNQHMRGTHGEGWKSLCGKRFSWATRKY